MVANAQASDDAAPAHVLAEVASMLRSGDYQTALALSEAALLKEGTGAEPAVDDAETDKATRIISPPLDTLSFVERRAMGGGYNYWANVPPAASYAEDCEIGYRLAEEFIQFIGAYHNYGNATLLGSIVVDMEKNGAGRGHKIGFLNTINKYAMGGAYLKHASELEPEHPWAKCRRLGKELSQALAETGDAEFAYVRPAGADYAVCFGALPQDGRLESDDLGFGRLRVLLNEVGAILHYHPELKIERISINEYGVHTFYKIAGFSDVLPTRIRNHSEAFDAWTVTVGPGADIPAEGAAFERLVGAELEFITHKCRGDHEVQMKLAYVAECQSIRDSILGDVDADGRPYQALFLDSLRLPAETNTGKVGR